MKSLKSKFFLSVGVYILVVLSLFIVSTYYLYHINIESIYKKNSTFVVDSKTDCIKEFIKDLTLHKQHIYTIPQTKLFKDYIDNKVSIDTLKSLFISTVSSNSFISQIRYIDLSGQEIIKINKKHSQIYVDDNLINVSKENCFINTLNSTKKIYTSPIEIKKDKQQIIRPLESIIKVSTKVYNGDKIVGIITSNIDLNFLLKKVSNNLFLETYLFDSDGYVILHPNSEKNWSRYSTKENIKDIFPNKYKNMLSLDCSNGNFFARQILIDNNQYSLVFKGNIKEFDISSKNISWIATILFILFAIPLSIFLYRLFSKFMSTDKDRISFLENSLLDKSKKLETLKGRFEAVESIAKIGVFEYNIQKDSIWTSHKLCQILNIENIKVTKETILSLISHIDKNYVLNNIKDMIKNKTKEKELKFRVVNNDTQILKCKLELFVDENKNVSIIKGICQDITDEEIVKTELIEYKNLLEVKVEKSLEKLRKKDDILLAQSRLASQGDIISMLAHQWRQPLARISTTLANIQVLFKLNTFDKDQISLEIDNINKQVKRLNDTITDFRTFFHPKENKEKVYVKDMVTNTIKLIKPLLDENSIEVEIDNECKEYINTYPNKLVQIILNILKNSIDQLVDQKVLEPKIEVNCKVDDGKLLYIKIADNGGGIDDDMIFNIFDAYFSTKGKNGTGLGLFISKTIANKYLDGDIKAYNNNKGAVFLIELQIKENKNERE
jgi:signal transduction histidine kinase